MDYDPAQLWRFLPWGYAATVSLETPVLYFGLAPHHSLRTKFTAALWLTACTYPIVVLALPMLLAGRSEWLYIAVAETFAPLAECVLFHLAFGGRRADGRPNVALRDDAAIVAANLTSFLVGGWLLSVF
ncbi:MAG: hypothetical protein JNL96_00225 [Planctomycetaceae bacterium]|nr:hypothetical protein [Planctomycetaceae bacterium]